MYLSSPLSSSLSPLCSPSSSVRSPPLAYSPMLAHLHGSTGMSLAMPPLSLGHPERQQQQPSAFHSPSLLSLPLLSSCSPLSLPQPPPPPPRPLLLDHLAIADASSSLSHSESRAHLKQAPDRKNQVAPLPHAQQPQQLQLNGGACAELHMPDAVRAEAHSRGQTGVAKANEREVAAVSSLRAAAALRLAAPTALQLLTQSLSGATAGSPPSRSLHLEPAPATLQQRPSGALSKFRVHEETKPTQTATGAVDCQQINQQQQQQQQLHPPPHQWNGGAEPFSYDPWGADDAVESCSDLRSASPPPVPVGRVWAHLSRYPTLHAHCIAHFNNIDEARHAAVERLRLTLAQQCGVPLSPRSAALVQSVGNRFQQLSVTASQLYLDRAQSQSTLDDEALRCGVPLIQPFVVAEGVAAAALQRGIDSVMSGGLSTIAALPAHAVAASAEMASPSLDAEADAEVASMAEARRRVVGGSLTAPIHGPTLLPAPHFTHPPASDTEMPTLELNGAGQLCYPRSVTSGSDASSSAATQRQSCSTPAKRSSANMSPPILLPPAGTLKPLHHHQPAANHDSHCHPRAHHDGAFEGDSGDRPDRIDEEDVGESLVDADDGASTRHQGRLHRSQSAQQRPTSSCRRRLDMSSAQRRPRTTTPSSTSTSAYLRQLAANAPLQKWLEEHFDDPYPSAVEKQQLSAATGLTYDQVQHWFINARMRKCKPRMAQRANSAITVAAQIAANDNTCAHDSPKKMKRERSDDAAQTATWAIQEDDTAATGASEAALGLSAAELDGAPHVIAAASISARAARKQTSCKKRGAKRNRY